MCINLSRSERLPRLAASKLVKGARSRILRVRMINTRLLCWAFAGILRIMDQSKDSNAALPQPVNWEAVRMLALVVGVRESARRMGISEEAVKKRCTREGWLATKEARAVNKMAIAQRTGVTASVCPQKSPVALIHAEITNLGGKSRLSLARGVAKAAETVESMSGDEILDRSGDVKSIAQTADLVHGWKDAAPSVKIRLDVLSGASEQPVFDVDCDVTAWDEATSDDLDSY